MTKLQIHRYRILLFAGAVIAILMTAGFISARSADMHDGAITVSALTSPILINPSSGATFSPAPTAASPALTAEQAWAKYAAVDGGSSTVPSSVTVHIGLITQPVGPAAAPGTQGMTVVNGTAYLTYNKLAYAYSEPSSCPQSRNPYATTPPPGSCINWLFLDANNGRQIMETWQVTN